MEEKLTKMFMMQDELNKKVDLGWVKLNRPWYRACWIEAAELAEHYGYKWWKKQECDMKQVKLELVDIWHFGVSDMIQQFGVHVGVKSVLDKIKRHAKNQTDILINKPLEGIDAFVQSTVTTGNFCMYGFLGMLNAFEMTLEEVYDLYIAKNCLNHFRQENGYKEGTYIKSWFGREDNEVLMDLVYDFYIDNQDLSLEQFLSLNLKAKYVKVEEQNS